MLVRRMARSISSGMAKMPSPIITMLIPSHRYVPPKANRSMAVFSSTPTVEIMTPIMATTSPLIGAFPLSTPTALRPQMTNMRNSGEPKLSTRGRRIGSETSRIIAPKIPPTAEAMKAAPNARFASPFCAIG